MKAVMAIAWRDIRSLIWSPMMHLIWFLCAALLSFFFLNNLREFANKTRLPDTGFSADYD